jgi:hypothetical protein
MMTLQTQHLRIMASSPAHHHAGYGNQTKAPENKNSNQND